MKFQVLFDIEGYPRTIWILQQISFEKWVHLNLVPKFADKMWNHLVFTTATKNNWHENTLISALYVDINNES